jgi:hypothetical protein
VNAGQAIAVLLCLGTVLILVLSFEVAVFLIACSACRVPRPGVLRTVGLALLLVAVPSVVDAIFSGALYEVYKATNYPLWEAGLVGFFISLPVHMTICSVIHAKVVRIRVTEGIAVWLIEKLIKLTLLTALVGVIALLLLVSK